MIWNFLNFHGLNKFGTSSQTWVGQVDVINPKNERLFLATEPKFLGLKHSWYFCGIFVLKAGLLKKLIYGSRLSVLKVSRMFRKFLKVMKDMKLNNKKKTFIFSPLDQRKTTKSDHVRNTPGLQSYYYVKGRWRISTPTS